MKNIKSGDGESYVLEDYLGMSIGEPRIQLNASLRKSCSLYERKKMEHRTTFFKIAVLKRTQI